MAGAGLLKERWRVMVGELAAELSGDWQVVGRGWVTSLVRRPEPWTLAWIGFTKSGFSDDGWFHAGVAPLVTDRFDWSSPFGVRIDEVPGLPKQVDLTDPAAAGLLRTFATGSAAERIAVGPAN